MKSTVIYLAVIFAVLAMASGQVLRRLCPHVTTMANFSASRYEGVWYEEQKFNNFFETGLKCIKASYIDLGNGVIQVTNMGTTKWGLKTYITGTATAEDPDKPAKLTLDLNTGSLGKYWILFTDYDNYAVVYNCKTYFTAINVESAWILSRSKASQLSDSLKSKIYSQLRARNIDPGRFTNVFDSSCD